jgi:D-alanyl-D-alanine carboxypeptidase/D-alanyl-D-alanine-endopeptidase (penicillin-binding protein 4)
MSLRRCTRLLPVCVLLLAGLPSLPAGTTGDLGGEIDKVINRPEYREARWGILVADAETGKPLYEHEADRLFIPASTTKLYSCAAALLDFGPDYRFVTPVYRRGELDNGRLKGDLILVAQGDLTLGGRTDAKGHMVFRDGDHIYATFAPGSAIVDTDPLAGLKDLARQVASAGVRQVDGDVLIDDRLFEHSRGSGSGPDVLTPIIVNDNVVDVIVTPAARDGEPATVRCVPETSFVQMDAQVTTVGKDKGARLEVHGVGSERFTVRGHIAVNSKPRVGIYPVRDPAGFARALLIEALRKAGVKVSASPLASPRADLPERDGYGHLTRVAAYTSPPLSEAIKVTLKVSHNLYASTLPLLLAAHHGRRTLADGMRRQRKVLKDLGVPVETISFAGGAGGANADSVTPRATAQLLRAMRKRSEYAAYHAGLPVLGVDGTLATAVSRKSPARGQVQAKTGTLLWHDYLNGRSLLTSKAVAGVMTTAAGRRLVFAMFVNNVPLPPGTSTTRESKTLGRLCEIIYEKAK